MTGCGEEINTLMAGSDGEQKSWCVRCSEILSKASILLTLFAIIIMFFLVGKVVLGNSSTVRSFISLRTMVAQNFMSTHPIIIEICQCRPKRWTDSQALPSPEPLAWQRTNLTWILLSLSLSLCHALLFPVPTLSSLSALPPSAESTDHC